VWPSIFARQCISPDCLRWTTLVTRLHVIGILEGLECIQKGTMYCREETRHILEACRHRMKTHGTPLPSIRKRKTNAWMQSAVRLSFPQSKHQQSSHLSAFQNEFEKRGFLRRIIRDWLSSAIAKVTVAHVTLKVQTYYTYIDLQGRILLSCSKRGKIRVCSILGKVT
jgi:hypothetical protein